MGLFSIVSGTLLCAGAVIASGPLDTAIGDRLPVRLHERLFGVRVCAPIGR
jgi:hypothetical protein